MPDRDTGSRRPVSLAKAAEYLDLPAQSVEALVDKGYLAALGAGSSGPEFALVDLKAFLARNADNGSGNILDAALDSVDPQTLLDALDGRSEEMARRAFEIFSTVFPESRGWSLSEQARFIDQARARFEAILAVTGQGAEVDEALVGDLQEVGASAAWAGSPLPQLLVVLRISRDLVVQTAVELAEERGRHWGLALSLLLTRVLPAMDRLTDALAQGYWAAVVEEQKESRARYENVVEHSFSGIWEVDLEGRIQYANPALGIILGRPTDGLVGTPLTDIVVPLDTNSELDALITEPLEGAEVLELTIVRADGVRRVLEVRTMPRYHDAELVGFQGVVRDTTTAHDLEAEKNEFLALVTHDLRTPLSTILGLGSTLEAHGRELGPDHIQRTGESIRRHAERIARLADDLYDVSRLEASSLLLAPRPVDLARVVEVALHSVDLLSNEPSPSVEVKVPTGTAVLADPRRLEQVVANLVENALVHGAPPVGVELRRADGAEVELVVVDHGGGVAPLMVPRLFSRLQILALRERDRARGTGLGLSLVRGLVEAMGGRVWYEPAPEGGACFAVTLPVPHHSGSIDS
ncbi:MAG TPA: ATP-binding protein [Acidimicrobiales bacterium]